MKILNKKNQISDDQLENAGGGIKSWNPGWYSQQAYYVTGAEGDQLGIAGDKQYSRNELAKALLRSSKIKEFSSHALEALEHQTCASDMDNILVKDFKLKID